MEYSYEDYQRDLNDPTMPHLKDRERFLAFYDKLGSDKPALGVQYPAHRMDWVAPRKGGYILELGCHAGYDIVKWLLEDTTAHAVGVDISKPLLVEAHGRALVAGIDDRAVWVESFIEDLPNDTEISKVNYTDIVLTETLEHVQDPVPVLKAALHFMGDETLLWISVPNHRWGNFSHVRGLNSEQLTEALVTAGFKDSDIGYLMERDSTTYAIVGRRKEE